MGTMRKWGRAFTIEKSPGPPPPGEAQGDAFSGAEFSASGNSVSLGQSLPRLAAIRTTRTTTDVLDVKETPKLRLDKLKGNVFVNQYLVIKELGRGTHGTVKLVFDTEQQVVYAMKVIHRKCPQSCHVNARCNSYSAGSPCNSSPAYHNRATTGANGLVREYSVSLDTSIADHKAAFQSSGPFFDGTEISRQLQPLYSANGAHKSCSGSGSRPISSQGLQHVIQEVRSGTASSVGFRSSPGVMQHSSSGLQSASNEEQSLHLQKQQKSESDQTTASFCPPCESSASAASQLDSGRQSRDEDGIQTLSNNRMLVAETQVAAGTAPLLSLNGHNATRKEECVNIVNASASERMGSAAEGIDTIVSAKVLTMSGGEDAAHSVAATAGSGAADKIGGPPLGLLNSSISPCKPPHEQQLNLDGDSPAVRSVVAISNSFTAGTCGSTPTAGVVKDAQTAELMREMAVMKKLDHPHVVALHEVIHDPDAKLLIMVMEFMPGGPLLSSTGHGNTEPIPEAAARSYFRELIAGLDYLHHNLIIHGDLKPDNLLLSAEGRLKIGDFGSATVLPSADVLISSTPGTPAFMAPEMCGLRSEPYNPFTAECWALGVCLFMFVYGRVPYSAPSTGLLYERIRSPQPVELPSQPVVSAELQHLLTGLLDKSPATRFNIEQVCCHQWVTDQQKLPQVLRCCQQLQEGVASLAGSGVSTAEQMNAITALKKQVKEAIPSVEERVYKKGQILLQQGKVPEGLFLILHGECELVISNVLPEPAMLNRSAENYGVQQSGPSVAAIKKDMDMDFAEHLSSSSTGSDDADEEAAASMGDGSYSPLARSYNRNAVHILQAAMAAIASTGNQVDDAAMQIQQGQPEEVLPPASRTAPPHLTAGGAPAAAPTAEIVSHEDILPKLLPPPRWGTGPSDDSRQAKGSANVGTSSPAATVAAVVGRGFARSAGPVLSLSLATDTEHDSKQGDVQQPYSPRNAATNRQSMSMAVDAMDRHVPGHGSRVSFDNLVSLKGIGSSYGATGHSSAAVSPRMSSTSCNTLHPSALPAFRYPRTSLSSAPDLQKLLHSPRGALPARPGSAGAAAYPDVWPGSPTGVVQRSASSATMGKVLNRAMRRSESMHRRMKLLVDQAKSITEHNAKRQELVGIRGPGQVVGDTSLGSSMLPASATVRARTRMKVLVVRRADAAALRQQPIVKAALLRTQTESSVLETLESFVTYDTEVTAIDELRKTLAAASQSLGCSPLSESYSLAAGAKVHMLAIANGATGGDAGWFGSFSGVSGSLGKLLMTAGSGSATYPADGSDEESSGTSSLPAVAQPGFGSGHSFAAVAAAISGRSSPECSQCPGSPRRSVTPGHLTPPTACGLSSNSSHALGSSVLPSRVSSSSRFALGAANGSQPHSLQISPMPSVTVGPGKNFSQRSMAV